MSWAEAHRASEIAAIEAKQAQQRGDGSHSTILYAKAARHEHDALNALSNTKVRTRGITGVSAVSLWYKAENYAQAEQLAYLLLADGTLPEFARTDLRNLVQAIWTESAKRDANVNFLPGQIFVSVKGGEVITGGAPLDLIVEKVQTIQSMFYRTVEFVNDLPLRKGGPPQEIQEICRPWLLQAPPGSYQFAVVIQESRQRDLFRVDQRPDQIARHFLEIVKATANEDPKQLEALVPKAEYRNAFLKLSRNLAPTSKNIGSVELRSTAADNKPIELTQSTRTVINKTLRPPKTNTGPVGNTEEEQELSGALRAVDLEKDYLELLVDGNLLHVVGLGDAMDDVIGPMVNKSVKVRVIRDRRGKFHLNDIELDQ